jgi:hypothetical protein
VFDDVINMEKAITDSYYALYAILLVLCSCFRLIFIYARTQVLECWPVLQCRLAYLRAREDLRRVRGEERCHGTCSPDPAKRAVVGD